MKELVEQVIEAQKNTKVAQMKLVKGRRQIGKAGSQVSRGLPSSIPPCQHPALKKLLWSVSQCPWRPGWDWASSPSGLPVWRPEQSTPGGNGPCPMLPDYSLALSAPCLVPKFRR
jgi:hypothetical protein